MSEKHLGGNFGVTHTDTGALAWAKEAYGATSMLDVGCGVGGQVKEAVNNGYVRATGIDGDQASIATALQKNATPKTGYICHDFCKDPKMYPGQFDLIWCVEFLEHIYEGYLPCVFQVMESAQPKVIICTAAAPNQIGGVHHVNCRPKDYWTACFMAHLSFKYDQAATDAMKSRSTMKREFIRNTGMVFVRGSK